MRVSSPRRGAGGLSRRMAVQLLGATAATAALAPRALADCRYKLSERLSLKGKLIIDVHCHIFNLSDLPVEQFLRQVQFQGRAGGFLGQAIRFVKNLQRRAVGFRSENRLLDRGPAAMVVAALRTRDFRPGADAPETDDERALGFALKEAMTKQEDLGSFSASDSQENAQEKFAAFLEQKYGVTRAPGGVIKRAKTRGWKEDSFSDDEEDTASRTLDWGRLLTRSRTHIALDMMRIFSPKKGHASVDLYTPALVDFEYWLGETPPTSIPQQIHLMERIIIEQRGRLHGFVPFCPWRQIDDEARKRKKTALHRVEDAILNRGFVGIKLYPPMGFRPIGNATLKRKDFPAHLKGKPYAADFGKRLDAALLKLYDFCVAHDACIMVHTAPTQHAGPGYDERPHPKYWRRLLAMPKYTDLRVNLAHFGGFELAGPEKINFGDAKGWHHNVGKALLEHKNVYADLSHFDGLLTDGCDGFRKNMIAFLRAFPGAEHKMMYGSDWSFISRTRFHGRYLDTMASWLIRKVVGKATTYDIMGPNASRFIGLEKGQAARKRLEEFYRDNDMRSPGWMKYI